MRRTMAQDRLHRFRRGLTISIRRSSPLTLAIVQAERPRLARILRRLRPPADAVGPPRTLPHRLRHTHARLVLAHYVGNASAIEDETFRSSYRLRGVVVRKPSHPRGRYAVWVAKGSLNAVVSLGRSVLHVEGSGGRLELAASLPLAIQAAIVGRPIGHVAEHALLSDQDWIVTGTADGKRGTTIAFETGTVPILPLFPPGELGFAARA